MPALLFYLAGFYPTNASAQGVKPTRTNTFTSTVTPTDTPTDSLNVFETPSTPTPDPQKTFISDPVEGSLVRGMVNIMGKTAVTGFSRYEVEFAYNSNSTDTWFLITRSDTPINEGVLAKWDTGGLTDGDYVMRLRVFFIDGSMRETFIKDIKVRNYTPTQTSMPAPTLMSAPTDIPPLTVTPKSSPYPTPSPLPTNAIDLSTPEIWYTLGRGATAALFLFLVFGWLVHIRNKKS